MIHLIRWNYYWAKDEMHVLLHQPKIKSLLGIARDWLIISPEAAFHGSLWTFFFMMTNFSSLQFDTATKCVVLAWMINYANNVGNYTAGSIHKWPPACWTCNQLRTTVFTNNVACLTTLDRSFPRNIVANGTLQNVHYLLLNTWHCNSENWKSN